MVARGIGCAPLVLSVMVAGLALQGVAASGQADSATDMAKVERYLQERLEKEGFPSLSVGIVREDGLAWAKAIGVADRKSGRPATPDTLYRIGSITKVFTASLLVLARDRGEVRLDDAVAKYLPRHAKLPADPRGAPAITLRHLATHTSGLPRIPPNLTPANGDPYNNYTPKQLMEALAKIQLRHPVGAQYEYSNLGYGLLGYALERKAGRSYETLLRERLLKPLDMRHTLITLKPEHRSLFVSGYQVQDTQAEAVDWKMGVLTPAGGIASSVSDLAKFLALQFKAGTERSRPLSGGSLTELHTPQRLAGSWGMGVGLGWHVLPSESLGDIVWHNGGMAGYTSWMGFAPKHRIGVIVLTNCGKSVDAIGLWLLREAARAYGEKANAPAAGAKSERGGDRRGTE